MFICTAKLSKGKAAACLGVIAAAVLAGVVVMRGGLPGGLSGSGGKAPPHLASDAERTAYLRDLGWETEAEPVESFRFLLPEPLEEPYLSYNALQLPQGFDLARYCGQELDRYTYAVTNYPDRPTGVQANLYLCDGTPVAGDIFCPGANGFQEPLIRSG